MRRVKEDVEKVAKKNNWIINQKDKVVEGNLRVQNRNIEKFGQYY